MLCVTEIFQGEKMFYWLSLDRTQLINHTASYYCYITFLHVFIAQMSIFKPLSSMHGSLVKIVILNVQKVTRTEEKQIEHKSRSSCNSVRSLQYNIVRFL